VWISPRAAVNGSLSSIGGTRTALRGAVSANAISEKNFSSGGSGVATADASVKSALGALNAAQARLDKTIVRSPISGTINSLAVETGDFVSPYSEIAVVGNNGALEIVAYATEDDATLLKTGGKVTIGESTPGVITRIASALDPRTKKIELRIGISGDARSLVNGATVRIAAARAIGSANGNRPDVIQIPLSALKITPTGSVVFTVSASSTLVAHPVKEGTLLGERVVITEGLSPDMMIITDARGHKDGEAVTVVTK
jgi:RND family efflux transporter MFP subunit